MANKRISDLPAETDPASTDVFAIDGATTRKATRADVLGDNIEAIRGLTSAADKGIQFTGAGMAAVYDLTAAGKALLDDVDAAAQRTTLGLVIGTNVQAYDAELAALAGLTSAADRLPYYTGSGTASLATFTAFGRSLVDDADASAARTTLSLGALAVENTISTSLLDDTVVSNAKMATMAAYTLKGNATGSSAVPTDIDVTALTSKASPVSGDIVLIQDSAASNSFKKTTVGALASAGSVASLNAQIGAIIHNVPRRVQGLTGSRNSGAATRLDLTADIVTFIDPSTSLAVVVSSPSLTACDIATAGPIGGGRDQSGAFSSGSTLHFYWIAKAGGTAPSVVASLAAPSTGPTLPSTYTMWAYATTMVMTGSNLPLATIRGSTVMYQTVQTLLSAGTATSETSVTTAVSTVVPANALTFQALLYLDNSTAGTGAHTTNYRVITGVNQVTVSLGVAVASGSAATSMTTVLPNVSQTLLYINSSALTRATASIMGYTVPNGDS